MRDETAAPRTKGQLIVLSHLRWVWVWQRPQHLISRLAEHWDTWFVEEPSRSEHFVQEGLATASSPPVTRAWWEVPGRESWIGFNDEGATGYGPALASKIPTGSPRVAWLYTAMAIDYLEYLQPDLVVYDVMDDLASFKDAAPEHRLRHHAALRDADIVFTGGRSLHLAAAAQRKADIHCFPSGVEPHHYAPAIEARPSTRARPVAGYVGVIDERLDLALIADLAARLPDWDIEMVGPVAKIDPAMLPTAPNLRWRGARPYGELPAVMARFDVALMPFALNDATRAISPTKTLEYFAAGLPVVSSRVPDVLSDFGHFVHFADDARGFADACMRAAQEDLAAFRARVAPLIRQREWDTVAQTMSNHIDHAVLARAFEARAADA